jgi:hypothetical protein
MWRRGGQTAQGYRCQAPIVCAFENTSRRGGGVIVRDGLNRIVRVVVLFGIYPHPSLDVAFFVFEEETFET